MNYADCSRECWVLVLIYLGRLQNVSLDAASVYTLTLCALVVSVKYLEDSHRSNQYYSKLGGVSVCLLNELEIEFL